MGDEQRTQKHKGKCFNIKKKKYLKLPLHHILWFLTDLERHFLESQCIQTGALRFICSPTAFPDSLPLQVHLERFIALIAATGDAYYEASSMGEDGLKRIKLPDLEDKMVVDRLYQMYQGSNRGQPVPGKYLTQTSVRTFYSSNMPSDSHTYSYIKHRSRGHLPSAELECGQA